MCLEENAVCEDGTQARGGLLFDHILKAFFFLMIIYTLLINLERFQNF